MLLSEDKPLILVVDDESMVRNLVSSILTRCGYQVRSAVDGRTRRSCFTKNPKK